MRSFLVSGLVAGAASAFAFVVLHDLLISDIWFSLGVMLAAGAVCGVCVAWSYALMFERPTLGSWLRYNLLYVALFGLLGLLSVLFFEPVTTVAAVLAGGPPPPELFVRAAPLTVVFTLLAAALISRLYGRRPLHYTAVLLTCVVLVVLLGMNVSLLGLVSIPGSAVLLVFELFGLIFALAAAYAGLFAALRWKQFWNRPTVAPAVHS